VIAVDAVLLALVFFFIGFMFGAASEFLEYCYKDKDKCNGWLARPFKYFACGAFHGHEWKKEWNPETCVCMVMRCKRCGKTKLLKHSERMDATISEEWDRKLKELKALEPDTPERIPLKKTRS